MRIMTPAADKKFSSPNAVSEALRQQIKAEISTVKDWPSKWGWILEEYNALKEDLDKITEKSVMVQKKEITDHRTIRPVPSSVNHEYGWLAGRPEFRLEIYGSDIYQATRLPPHFRI